MRMDRDPGVGGPLVAGFVGNGFRIQESRFDALLLTIGNAQPWSPPRLSDLTIDDIAPLLADTPEFILLGTGAALVRPPAAFVAALAAQNIGVEPMDSRAAARAWGVLRGEGRAIAAALYPLDA
ncbi:MAG: MTH938/NDUFAF3 family protein [Pseudomonadota bacterium]|nr:MTH938/NDUFAF3 family protein [Pseudomonadota bacterium]